MDKNLIFIVDSFLRVNKKFVPRNAFDVFGEPEGFRIFSALENLGCIDSYTKDGVELNLDKLRKLKDSIS